jgi:uncharacterized protein
MNFGDRAPLVLLPPSEGKAVAGSGSVWDPAAGYFNMLGSSRSQVVNALRAADGGSQKLLGVGGQHLDRARLANAALVGAPTLPAWQRYSGVVWSNLDPSSLGAVARRRIVVVSGLLGLVRGDDPIPDYRLKMSASLHPLGKLSAWWRQEISVALNRIAQRRFLIDLLPQEHRAAWVPGPRLRGSSIGFVDRSGSPGGHFAKAAKGRLAREVLLRGAAAVNEWSDDRFDLVITPLTPDAR